MPANAIDLGHRQQAIESHSEHVPEALLEHFWIGTFSHLVLTDHEMLWDDLSEILAVELFACDLRENDAEAIREHKSPLIRMTLRRQQGFIPLKEPFDGVCILPGLSERMELFLQSAERH